MERARSDSRVRGALISNWISPQSTWMNSSKASGATGSPRGGWSPSPPEVVPRPGVAARLQIRLGARELEVTDAAGRVIAHFPVSIARRVEKRPVGELRVRVVVAGPDYTIDPALFADSAEARELGGRKLILPPGPNNPVGVAWIGLDRPGYGIHGTPEPANVGRTESLGCFRLANWNAELLLRMVWVGMPILVEP